jgi:integrase
MSYKYEDEIFKLLDSMKKEKGIPEESMKRAYEPALNSFVKFMSKDPYSDTPINSISVHIISKYFIESKVRNATIIIRYRALNYFFHHLYKDKKIIINDIFLHIDYRNFLSEKETPASDEILSIDDKGKIYSFICDLNEDISNRLKMALIMYQGLSKGEILSLSRSDIDFDFLYLYTRKTQDGEVKNKILSKKVSELLKEYIIKYKPNFNNTLFNYAGTTDSEFNHDINKLTKMILGREVSPTKLRESFRLKLIEENKSKISLVTEFLGESEQATKDCIKKHNIIAPEDIEDEIRNMIDTI